MTRPSSVLRVLALLSLLALSSAAFADVRLGDPAVDLDHPSVAVGSDGLLRVVWAQPVAGIWQIHWAAYDDGGQRIHGPVQLTLGPYSSVKPRLALDDRDHSHVVWQNVEGRDYIGFARVAADGGIEAAARKISTRDAHYSDPDIATDPATRRSHVASHYEPTSLFYIEYMLVDEDGALLARDVPASDDITMFKEKTPAVTLDPAGTAIVVYQDYAGFLWPTAGFWRVRYNSSGTRLSRTEIAVTTYAYPVDVVSTSTGGTQIFYQKSSGTPHIYRLEGSSSILESPLPGPSRGPRLAAADGHPLFMVYQEDSAPGPRVLAQQWTLGGECVADTLRVSHSSGQATQPDIATDGSGRYFVVWKDTRDGSPAIYLGTLPPFGLDVHVRSATTGHPVPQAEVTLQLDGVILEEGVSDDEGICRFRDHEVDEAVVMASFQGRPAELPSLFPFPHDRVDSVAVSVPTDLEVSGRVLDEHNGLPVPDYRVQLLDELSQSVFEVHSRSDGWFYLYAQDPGSYEVLLTKQAEVGSAGMSPVYPDTLSDPFPLNETQPLFELGTLDLPSLLVVMVHGVNSSSAIWRDSGFAALLRARGWTVLDDLDLPGQILGLPIYGMARISDQARRLQKVTEAYQVPNFQVVAHSQGGLVTRFLLERLEAERTPRVQRLITLATPHHGSPLATSIAGILRLMSATVPPDLGSVEMPTLLNVLEESYPAFVDLRPNSKFLRLLNQGDEEANDWRGFCAFAPHPESELRAQTAYLAVGGTEHPWAYEIGHKMMLPFGCLTTDGVVPLLSALLQNETGGNVLNHVWDGVHHKTAPSIHADPALHLWVADCLETPPEQWQPPTSTLARAAVGSGEWTPTTLLQIAVPVDGTGTAVLAVDPCDTLLIDWSWFEGDVDLRLRSPSGVEVDSLHASLDPQVSYLRLPADRAGRYALISPEAGMWMLEAEASGSSAEQNVIAWALAEGAIAFDLAVDPPGADPFAARRAAATLADAAGQPLLGASVSAQLRHIGGGTETIVLGDDGLQADLVAGDGVYSAWIDVEDLPGTTVVDAYASGTQPTFFSRRALHSIHAGDVTDIRIEAPGLEGSSRTGLLGSRVHLSASILNAGPVDASVEIALWREDMNLRLKTDTLTIAVGTPFAFRSSYMPLQEGTPRFRLTAAPLDVGEADWGDNTALHEATVGPVSTGVRDPEQPEGGGDRPAMRREAVRILRAFPNPFNPTLQIEFALRAAARVEMEIYDLRGRRLLRQTTAPLPAGTRSLRWDGRDQRGRTVASGVYLVRLRVGEDVATRKVALVR